MIALTLIVLLMFTAGACWRLYVTSVDEDQRDIDRLARRDRFR